MPIPVVAVLLVVVFALGWLVCWSRAYNDPTSLTHWKIEARKWQALADDRKRGLLQWKNKAHQLAARIARQPSESQP